MDTKIKRWGNSQGVIIPKTILAKMNIDDPEGQPVKMSVEDNKLIIVKKTRQSNMAKRFEGFDLKAYYAKYGEPQELDWGNPVGKESF